MKLQSITAALLSAVLLAGCSDRNDQNAGNPTPNGAVTSQDGLQPDGDPGSGAASRAVTGRGQLCRGTQHERRPCRDRRRPGAAGQHC